MEIYKRIIRSSWLMLGLLFLPLHAGAATPPIGWAPNSFFPVVENSTDSPEFHREFYPKGESASHWTERVVVSSQLVAAGTTPNNVLDALLKSATDECHKGKEDRFPVRPEDEATSGVAMWHCSKGDSTSRGEVAIRRVLLSGDRGYIITAQGDYPPFEQGKTPLLKGQLDRWAEFQKSFAVCSAWTVRGCMPDAKLIMSAGAADLTAEEADLVRKTEQRGIEMFRQDQIAWHGTDFAMDKKLVKTGKNFYVAEIGEKRSGDLYLIAQDAAHPSWVRVDSDESGHFSEGLTGQSLPEPIRVRLAALTLAHSAKLKSCSERLNTIVMPDDSGDGWLVYFLSSSTKPGEMLLGGHTRVRVNKSASQILSTDYSTNSCVTFDLAQPGDSKPKSAEAATPVVTHLVSEMPWETHVFQSLTFNTDLLVVTKHAIWRVGHGKITKLKVE